MVNYYKDSPMKPFWTPLAGALISGISIASAAPTAPPLSSYAHDPAPWSHIEANSDQRQPQYLGATPRQMAVLGKRAARPSLSAQLRSVGEKQLQTIRTGLKAKQIEVE